MWLSIAVSTLQMSRRRLRNIICPVLYPQQLSSRTEMETQKFDAHVLPKRAPGYVYEAGRK